MATKELSGNKKKENKKNKNKREAIFDDQGLFPSSLSNQRIFSNSIFIILFEIFVDFSVFFLLFPFLVFCVVFSFLSFSCFLPRDGLVGYSEGFSIPYFAHLDFIDLNHCFLDIRSLFLSRSLSAPFSFFCLIFKYLIHIHFSFQGIPQQMNAVDCGMFALKFAEYLSRRSKLTFTQADMPYFRRRMMYEIISNTLLHP